MTRPGYVAPWPGAEPEQVARVGDVVTGQGLDLCVSEFTKLHALDAGWCRHFGHEHVEQVAVEDTDGVSWRISHHLRGGFCIEAA